MSLLRKFLYIFIVPMLFTSSIFYLEAKSTHFNFDFLTGNQGWQGDFTDYPVGEESFFQLAWGWTNLPASLTFGGNTYTKGMYLSGDNRSDDLFMFIRRQLRDLKQNTEYELTFNVTIENNIPPGQFGIGGSPGESVFFKVGASTIQPKKVNVNGFYLLNVDKGDQAQGGKNAIVVGNLANPLVNPLDPQYEPKAFINEKPLRVKTDRNGHLWVFVGTDSGFEGSTLYYIAHINVRANPVDLHCKK